MEKGKDTANVLQVRWKRARIPQTCCKLDGKGQGYRKRVAS
ncbi:hypothetical protein [Bacillus thuringiensis]|nr:hypothetical protein [Bacillus thuringiensis]